VTGCLLLHWTTSSADVTRPGIVVSETGDCDAAAAAVCEVNMTDESEVLADYFPGVV
jgi:hypothetical protein